LGSRHSIFLKRIGVLSMILLYIPGITEKPVANICEADPEEFITSFKQSGCMIHRHQFGYRSVHYAVIFSPSRIESTTVEIQVRTILEEVWSEIDHLIRYP